MVKVLPASIHAQNAFIVIICILPLQWRGNPPNYLVFVIAWNRKIR